MIRPEIVLSQEISVKLDEIGDFLGGNPYQRIESDGQVQLIARRADRQDDVLSTEEVVMIALPAVVTIKSRADREVVL